MRIFTFIVLISSIAHAQSFKLTDRSSLDFKVPYTMGTHEGKAKQIEGSINFQSGGTLSLPITALKTGNEEMDCHLYESLGLNYDKSDFPDDHVCEDDKLPKKGKNAIVYPKITYVIDKIKVQEDKRDKKVLQLTGRWNIHGKDKAQDYTIELIKQDNTWVTNKKLVVSLFDFDIIVKKFLFISVEDLVKVKLNLVWEQV